MAARLKNPPPWRNRPQWTRRLRSPARRDCRARPDGPSRPLFRIAPWRPRDPSAHRGRRRAGPRRVGRRPACRPERSPADTNAPPPRRPDGPRGHRDKSRRSASSRPRPWGCRRGGAPPLSSETGNCRASSVSTIRSGRPSPCSSPGAHGRRNGGRPHLRSYVCALRAVTSTDGMTADDYDFDDFLAPRRGVSSTRYAASTASSTHYRTPRHDRSERTNHPAHHRHHRHDRHPSGAGLSRFVRERADRPARPERLLRLLRPVSTLGLVLLLGLCAGAHHPGSGRRPAGHAMWPWCLCCRYSSSLLRPTCREKIKASFVTLFLPPSSSGRSPTSSPMAISPRFSCSARSCLRRIRPHHARSGAARRGWSRSRRPAVLQRRHQRGRGPSPLRRLLRPHPLLIGTSPLP